MERKKFRSLACILLSLALVLSCVPGVNKVKSINAETVPAEESSDVQKELQTASYGPYNVDTDTLPFTQAEIYNQLFDLNNIISVDVDITNEEIKKIQSDFSKNNRSPIYRMADVTISITIPSKGTYTYLINEVGIRLKGNTTRTDLYDESKGIYNLDHFKLKFGETFDKTDDGYAKGEYYINSDGTSKWDADARKVRKDRTFANLEKMDVKWNSNLDSTYIREYYAYEMFRSEGICAPHTGLATMQMNVTDKTSNSAYLGVYKIYEAVDSELIKNNLLDKSNNYIMNSKGDYTDGDLYKAAWAPGNGGWSGANLTSACTYGFSDDFTGYKVNYDLKTNKKKSDLSPIKNLISGLSNVSSKEDLAKYVDMDYFVKFAAVAYVVGNGDDMRNNYNNYYLYFYTDNTDISNPKQKAIVIPYDYDRCFGITNGYNPENTGMTAADPYSTGTAAQGGQVNPLYRYSVDKGGYYVSEYTEALKSVKENSLLTMSEVEKAYNTAKKNYADKVTPSKNFENASKDSFYFGIEADNNINTTSINTDDKNIIVSEYLTRMLSTLNKALGNSDSLTAAECYLRGEFSDWNVNDSYKMAYSKASGLHSFILELNDTKSFKIYNSTADSWYGYENIKGSVPSGISDSGENGNIKAQAGKYYLIYNASDNTIQISDKEIETEATTEKPTKPTPTDPDPTDPDPTDPIPTDPDSTPSDEPTSPQETTASDKVISITLNANGGKVGSSKTYTKKVTQGKKMGTLKSAVRAKYTFEGWYTKKSGGTKVNSSTVCKYTKNTTLYAHWKKVTVSKGTVKSLKSSSKKLMIVIKKVSGAKGYQIVYSMNSNFKKSKSINSTSLAKTVKNLKKGKTYYVKVRAYKLDSAKNKVYGSYSSARKVKIK